MGKNRVPDVVKYVLQKINSWQENKISLFQYLIPWNMVSIFWKAINKSWGDSRV